MNQDDWLRKRMRGKKRPGCGAEIGAFVLLCVGLAFVFFGCARTSAPAEASLGEPFPVPTLSLRQFTVENGDVVAEAAQTDDTFGKGDTPDRAVVVATWCSTCHAFLERMANNATIRAAFKHVLLLDDDGRTARSMMRSRGRSSAADGILFKPAFVTANPGVHFEIADAGAFSRVRAVPYAMRCANGTCQHIQIPEWGLR